MVTLEWGFIGRWVRLNMLSGHLLLADLGFITIILSKYGWFKHNTCDFMGPNKVKGLIFKWHGWNIHISKPIEKAWCNCVIKLITFITEGGYPVTNCSNLLKSIGRWGKRWHYSFHIHSWGCWEFWFLFRMYSGHPSQLFQVWYGLHILTILKSFVHHLAFHTLCSLTFNPHYHWHTCSGEISESKVLLHTWTHSKLWLYFNSQ